MSENTETRYRVADMAKEYGVSTTTIYKHLKRLKPQLKDYLIKEAGITYVAGPGAEILRDAIQTPAENPRQVQTHQPLQPASSTLSNQVSSRLEHLEKAVLVLADELKASRRIQGETQAQVADLVKENRQLRMLLTPPEPVKVIPWQPEKAKDPLEGMSWLKKTWLKFAHPERCRRQPN